MIEHLPITGPWAWSIFYGASLLLLAVAAVISIHRSGGRGNELMKWSIAFGLALATARAANGVEQWWPGLPEGVLATVRASIIFTVGTLATWVLSSAIVQRWDDRPVRWTAFLVIEGAWLLVISSEQVERFASPVAFDDAACKAADLRDDELIAVPNARLKTDTGRPISVYRVERSWEERKSSTALRPDRTLRFSYSAIAQAPPDFRANCHGWVFAGGRYVVRGAEVDNILSDNRYLAVDQPQTGDVVVYRRETDNTVVHTGLVKVVEQGLTLIESKWGLWGRYLHQPQHQPYSSRFTFYHSPRGGHELAEARVSDAVAPQPSSRHAVRKKRIQLSCVMPRTSPSL